MHLKRLEMIGFKSFAEKTVVSFDKGVSGIVGPNGCGKSNISDSIRWVLGEKSCKMLRGGKMEDMIFNGTEFRKPAGYCEVTIVFSNEDKMFPVEFSEVEITRKYYRGGESEYYLNRVLCRQKDVYDILMDTGVGSNTYCMVEQGRIDYIVRASAEERRFLIEEAAGISKYKHKKEEAMRKIERTEQNLLRINDIVTEVEKNIKYAERQARKAEKYKESYDKLRRLETFRAFEELDSLATDRVQCETRKQELDVKQVEFGARVAELQQTINLKNEEIDRLNEDVHEKEAGRYQLLSDIELVKNKIDFNVTRAAELKARTDVSEQTLAETGGKIALNQQQLTAKDAEYGIFSQERDSIHLVLEEKRGELAAITAAMDSLRMQIQSREKEVMLCAQLSADARNELTSIHMDMSKLESQIKRIDAQTEKLSEEKRTHDSLLIEKQTNLSLQKDELLQCKQHQERLKQARIEKEQELESARVELLNKRVVHKEIEARLRVLEELEKNYAGFKEGARRALQLKDAGDELFQSLTTLVSALNVQEGYETAVQAALADRIYAVIASSHEEAYEIITHLREQNLGQITIMINREDMGDDDIAIPYDPGFILGRAIEFVSVTEENKYIMKELFKRTLIIRNDVDQSYEEVVELSRQFKLVTLDGIVIGPNVYMSGGSDSETNTEMLTRDRKIKELKKDLDVLAHEQCVLTSHETNLVGQMQEIRNEFEQYEQSFYDRKVKIDTEEQLSNSVKDITQKIEMELSLLEREHREADAEIARLAALKSEKELQKEEYDLKQHEIEELLAGEKALVQEKVPQREQMQMDLAGIEARMNGMQEKDAYLRNALESLRHSIADDTAFTQKLAAEIEKNAETIVTLEQENSDLKSRQDEFDSELRFVDLELSRINSDVDDLQSKMHDVETDLARAMADLESAKEENHVLSMKIMDYSYRENAIHDRLRQTYKIELKELDRTTIVIEPEEREQLGTLILELSGRVESMGPVNLMAIDEYDSLKQRYEFLLTQRNDLTMARETLLEAVRKINRTIRKLFIDVFDEVKKNFNNYYQILFKGGEAQMVLLDLENPLESGIDIFVRPPGKKMQNISLYSGGEKALTAIALLFAVFKVKPSPYCVLDEVDAPLDEANIDRFLDVLKDFLSLSQFLIVTHNRKTIKMADTLFGITMEEPGVSKIVSVKMGDEAKFIDEKPQSKDKRTSIYKPKKNFNPDKIEELIGEKS